MFAKIVGKCPVCNGEMRGWTIKGPCPLDVYDIDEEHYLKEAMLILEGSDLICGSCQYRCVVSIADSLPKYVALRLLPL